MKTTTHVCNLELNGTDYRLKAGDKIRIETKPRGVSQYSFYTEKWELLTFVDDENLGLGAVMSPGEESMVRALVWMLFRMGAKPCEPPEKFNTAEFPVSRGENYCGNAYYEVYEP